MAHIDIIAQKVTELEEAKENLNRARIYHKHVQRLFKNGIGSEKKWQPKRNRLDVIYQPLNARYEELLAKFHECERLVDETAHKFEAESFAQSKGREEN